MLFSTKRKSSNEPPAHASEWNTKQHPEVPKPSMPATFRHIVDFKIIEVHREEGRKRSRSSSSFNSSAFSQQHPERKIFVVGNLINITKSSSAVRRVRLEVLDWFIDFGCSYTKGIWVTTEMACYKLLRPKEKFAPLFRPLRFRSNLSMAIVEALRCDVHRKSGEVRMKTVSQCHLCTRRFCFTSLNELVVALHNVPRERLEEEAEFLLYTLNVSFPYAPQSALVKELTELVAAWRRGKADGNGSQKEIEESSQLKVKCNLCGRQLLCTEADMHSETCLVVGCADANLAACA